jgi:hypothetical protein
MSIPAARSQNSGSSPASSIAFSSHRGCGKGDGRPRERRASGNLVRGLEAPIHSPAELYRRLSIPFGRDSGRDIVAEHAAILDATLARDPEQAVLRLSTHVERTSSILLASLAVQARSEAPA